MKRAFTMREIKEHDRLEDRLFQNLWSCKTGQVRANLLISRQLWRDNGQWDRYYQAREGRVHGSRYCPTLSETTCLSALWQFSGEDSRAVEAAGHRMCRKCFPELAGRPKGKAAACPGSGERSRCRCGDRECRQMCPHCGKSVLITPSGALRRHGIERETR